MDEFLSIFDKLFDMDGKVMFQTNKFSSVDIILFQNEEEILAFFNKIDYNCDGYINWVTIYCMYFEKHSILLP